MKQSTCMKAFILTLCTWSLAACDIESANPVVNRQDTASATMGDRDVTQLDQYIQDAIANATVQEIGTDDCIVTPVIDDGETLRQAAPNQINTDRQITIQYNTGCEFELALSDVVTGETTFQNASKLGIKKQTHILIFGEYQSDDVILADKVVVLRTQRTTKGA